MRLHFRSICALLFLAIGCAGPRQYSPVEQQVLRRHLVAFDATGDPLNPSAYVRGWKLGDQTLTDLDYQQKLIEISASARTFLAQDPEHRVLVFVHGHSSLAEEGAAPDQQGAHGIGKGKCGHWSAALAKRA